MIWVTQFLDSFRKLPPASLRPRKVGKVYHFMLRFDRGNANVTDRDSIMSMEQAVWRAKMIPEHIIEVEAREDPADPQEVGLALRRLEVLRKFFLDNSIPAERLEMQIHLPNRYTTPGERARLAEIRLFPRFINLRRGRAR